MTDVPIDSARRKAAIKETETSMTDRLLYRANEVADLLGVGITTAKALIGSGELRSVKIGRARRVPAEALHEYVQRLQAEQWQSLGGEA